MVNFFKIKININTNLLKLLRKKNKIYRVFVYKIPLVSLKIIFALEKYFSLVK